MGLAGHPEEEEDPEEGDFAALGLGDEDFDISGERVCDAAAISKGGNSGVWMDSVTTSDWHFLTVHLF